MNLKKIFLSLGVVLLMSAAAFCQSALPALTGKVVFMKTARPVAIAQQPQISPSMLISPLYYTNHLAFFCRQEIKFEKATKIPFKFRLGSVEQVDYLEGKHRSF